jgi:hypothetical protein
MSEAAVTCHPRTSGRLSFLDIVLAVQNFL